MRIERTKNTVKNIAVGLILKLYQTLAPFLMRTCMIHFMGVQYLGLNGLFTSILHVLNLAELGVGAAMVFSMYKPIAQDDEKTICALMRLYRRYYRFIGLVIGVVGLILTPFVPSLISGEIPSELNAYVLYLLNLAGTVLTYWLFAYKNCILQAHQRVDIANIIQMLSYTIQFVLQLAVVVWYGNYYLYVIITLLSTIMNNILTAVLVTKKFPQYRPVGSLDREQTRSINGRIRDLFTGKLGSVMVNSVDTIVISAFLGLETLAIYQNYYFILISVIGVIEIVLSSMMAGLGNSFVVESKEKNFHDLNKFTFIFLWITGVCVCCFLGLYQPFMEIWVGTDLMLGFSEVVCFTVYFYVYTFNRFMSVYKDAAGLWHMDRFRPLCTSIVNLTLNLLLVRSWGLCGILLATIVSMAFVGIPWLLRNLFGGFFLREKRMAYIGQLTVYVMAAALSAVIVSLLTSGIRLNILLSLLICVLVPNLVFYIVFRKHELFRPSILFLDRMMQYRLHLEKYLLRK